MIITEIQYFFSKIIRFQAIFKDTVEFTCALEFKISSQLFEITFSSSSQNTADKRQTLLKMLLLSTFLQTIYTRNFDYLVFLPESLQNR